MAEEQPLPEKMPEKKPRKRSPRRQRARSPEFLLPPGVEQLPSGQLVRRLEKPVTGGASRTVTRNVASTLEEARAKHWDWYHPDLGWIREGYKLEKDREPQAIMDDGSSATPDPNLVRSSQ